MALVLAAAVVQADPMRDAVRNGDVEAVSGLIGKGANLNGADANGLTPLLDSVFSGQGAVTQALLDAGANPNLATELDGNLLRQRGANVEAGERVHVTPLFVAVFLGNRDAVGRLLKARADVHEATDEGMKALHLVAYSPDPEIARLLIDSGADVNDRDAHAGTPLHAAAERGNAAVAGVLLERGAFVNALDDQGNTPLDVAYAQGKARIIKLLVSHDGVAMQEMLDAEIDVSGHDPHLVPLVAQPVLDALAPAGPRPLGIALDVAGHKLFWSEFANDALRSSDLDGSHAVQLDVAALRGPIGLAFDGAARELFWVTDATYPRKVQRAGADGSGVADLARGSSVNRPIAIAVDAVGRKIFWTESVAGRIRSADVDGSNVTDIVTSGISSEGDRPDAREFKALGIAVDGVNRKIYWSEMLDAQILRADLDGSNVETVVAASAGLELPAGIAVHEGNIFWVDAAAAKLQRANLDGSGIADVLTAADGLIEPYALAVDAEARRLYWTDASSGTVSSATLAGEDVRTLFTPSTTATDSTDGACASAAARAGRRYVWRVLNAVGTCLKKMDALKAVWRSQADAGRATGSCLRQLDRLAGGTAAADTLEGELRSALEGSCGTDTAELLRGEGPLRAFLQKRCEAGDARARPLDCVVAALTDCAWSQAALRYRRAAEWLEEARPLMAASSDTPATRNALANLDRVHGALRAMAGRAEPSAGAAATSPSVETSGQTTSYAALGMHRRRAFTSVPDDGAVRSGARPQYVDNGDGTITDVSSGLMWEKKCDGCGGLHDTQGRYALEPAKTENGVESWLAAVNSENGAGFAGHADWRLPTIKELQTLVDYERFNPAVSGAFDGAACGMGCNDLARPECSCTGMMWHCSATPFASAPERVFALGFHLGIVGDVRRTGACAVRAVRDAGPKGSTR